MIIGICDDEFVMREQMVDACSQIISKYNEPIGLEIYTDGEQLLEANMDILILDIEMQGMDGIAVKNDFQRRNKGTLIIFATSHEEMMSEAFGVNVLGFILKHNITEQLPSMLDTAIKRVMQNIYIEGVDSRDIRYIEADHMYNVLHTTDGGQISVRMSSIELEDKLSGIGFSRVHRTYIVNFEYVDRIKDKVIIVAGKEIPISNRLYSKVKKEYDTYCKENSRFC